MAVFEITAPNGKTYRIEGENQAGALAALQQHLGTAQESPEMTEGLATLSDMTTNPQVLNRERPNRTLGHKVLDNVVGIDDGVMSPGEKLGTMLNMGGESASFGLVGDEADAKMRSMLGQGSYDDNLAQYRQQEGQVRSENPYLSIVADISGALAVPAGVMGAASKLGSGLLTRMAAGGIAGGVGGATHGFMEGEGNFTNRVNNAIMPGILGTVAGGAIEPVSRGARALWGKIGPGAPAVARDIRRQLGLGQTAARMVGDAFEMDAPYMAENMARAGVNAPNAMAGNNTKGLLDWVVNRPGAAGAQTNAAIQDLASRAGREFSDTMDNTLGKPNGVARTQREIMQGTAQNRNDVYNLAYSTPINYASKDGVRLEGLMSRVPESALRRAEQLMKTEGTSTQQIKATISDTGQVVFETMPDVRQLDYITRALRDMGGFGMGEGADQGRAFSGLAREIRQTVDDLVPEYRAARSAGRDAIANREATEFGSSLLSSAVKMDVAEDTLADMTKGELAFARQGVRSYLDEIMANTKAALTDQNMDAREAVRPLKELLSGAGKRKMTALLGEEATAPFIAEAEKAFAVLNLRASVARGSATAPRQAAEDVLNNALPITPMEALEEGRGVMSAVMTGARPLISGAAMARAARKDGVMEQVGRALMAPSGTLPGQILAQQLSPAMRASDAILGKVEGGARGLMAAIAAMQATSGN